MKSITLTIEGMHCMSCEALLKDVLEEIEGVLSVEFSFKKGTGIVEYNEKVITPEKMVFLVDAEGYKVTGTK